MTTGHSSLLDTLGSLSLFISLGAISITSATMYLLGDTPVLSVVLPPFFAVYCTYNFDRLADTSTGEGITTHERYVFLQKYASWVKISIVCSFLLLIALGIYNGWELLTLVILFPIAGVFYVLPILPLSRIQRLKDIPAFKCFYVPACWCLFVIAGIIVSADYSVTGVTVFAVLFFYIRTFVSAYLGDMRDYQSDLESGVKTLIVIIGEKNSFWLVHTVHVASMILVLVSVYFKWIPMAALGLVFSSIIGYLFFVAFQRNSEQKGIFFDLYDFEFISYFPAILGMQWIISGLL